MAHSLRMGVIAEGVENVEQIDCLRAAGCDQIQGFYYSVPLPADDCAGYLRRHAAGFTGSAPAAPADPAAE
jgi:EAL domain-containing protein (putative c-di-GMP-specific phosphodiesterase class I)